MTAPLRAPFPWFGGKRRVAREVWARFGAVRNYVEPFFGSGAVLLGRPLPHDGSETVNDLDGFVANAWRAIRLAPDETARWADNPVNENDLHARHVWLLERRAELASRLDADPDFHDARIAGYWLWGLACWIGAWWCSGRGRWSVVDGRLVNLDSNGNGVVRKRIHLGNLGRGVTRQRIHLGGQQGVQRHINLRAWFAALSERLARVRVASGDWSRVCGPSATFKLGMTAVFLDPPYNDDARKGTLYRCDDLDISRAVREWAIENGARPDMRIALCGYDGEHDMPPDWAVHAWNAGQGYGTQASERSGNGRRERIWFSPACLAGRQGEFFAAGSGAAKRRRP